MIYPFTMSWYMDKLLLILLLVIKILAFPNTFGGRLNLGELLCWVVCACLCGDANGV